MRYTLIYITLMPPYVITMVMYVRLLLLFGSHENGPLVHILLPYFEEYVDHSKMNVSHRTGADFHSILAHRLETTTQLYFTASDYFQSYSLFSQILMI